MPEWLMGVDCKFTGLPTLVRIRLDPFKKILSYRLVNITLVDSKSICNWL